MLNDYSGVTFNIDPITKELSTPFKGFRLVAGDTNSVKLIFNMPKFISGFDMTECDNIKIHYRNIDLETDEVHDDAYPITDMREGDAGRVTFSYTIKPGATFFAGAFLLALTFRKGEDYIWSTNPYAVDVSERLDTAEAIKKNVPPDILEAWKAEIIAEVTAAVEVDEEKIADLVEDYLEKNPPTGGVDFTTDTTLNLDPVTKVLSVNTAKDVEKDNTLPITAAAVYVEIGNIDSLLSAI